jgi:hypothetical protein
MRRAFSLRRPRGEHMFVEEKRVGEIPLFIAPWQQNLLDAADLLDKRGWCQLSGKNNKGEACTQWAIAFTADNEPRWLQAAAHFQAFLGEPVWSYNDEPGRKKEEVTAALRACAWHGMHVARKVKEQKDG